MSGGIGRRLDRLAATYQARGCPACRSWDRTTVEIVPANVTPIPLARSDRCPSWGWRAPNHTAVVQIVKPDDGDAGIVGR